MRRVGKASAKTSHSRRFSMATERQLADLISIGPAMLRDFNMLGILSVAQLAKQEPRKMYERLNRKTGQRQDPCVLDTFCAAVAQARNPRLPANQCEWWYWSRKRKSTKTGKQQRRGAGVHGVSQRDRRSPAEG